MKLEKYKNIYFIGIGGIGMSALARWFNNKAYNIAGYDRSNSEITSSLQNQGVNIHFDDDVDLIPESFKNPNSCIVIYTPAIPKTHSELLWFRTNNFKIFKRAEILGVIARDYECIAVAGTHGKTSVSTLIAYIFNKSSDSANAFLGGISVNYNSNLIYAPKSEKLVIEADEFDRSFLHLSPNTAVVTHIDADHLDIYGSYTELLKTFKQFASNIPNNGTLFCNIELIEHFKNLNNIKLYSYTSDNPKSDFYAKIVNISDKGTKFDLVTPSGIISNIILPQVGSHHLENAVVAIAIAQSYGISENEIKNTLVNYKGVRRRYELITKTENITFIDDYAHHPKELSVTINALRTQFPGKYITGIFQPHLFSRTRDLADEFAIELSKLDELILLEIYPARELPIQGIDSNYLIQKVKLKNKQLLTKSDLLQYIETKLKCGILVTLGAGDIDRLVKPISKILLK
ncbi:MAG: UDP-N-acetylmuramate--L-alanine ligase [Bacteroidales bacterium]|nr:UDP-N-acetylmuramate--L-alanine ligase [Bacteroidales bacterium]